MKTDANLIVMPTIQFKELIAETVENTLRKVLSENNNNDYSKKLFSIHRAAKEIGIHSDTLRKRIKAGYVETTPDGKFISGAEIEKYVSNKNADSGL